MVTVEDHIEFLRKNFKPTDHIATAVWAAEDIRETAKQMKISGQLSAEDVDCLLEDIDRHHDSSQGIDFSYLEEKLKHVIERKTLEMSERTSKFPETLSIEQFDVKVKKSLQFHDTPARAKNAAIRLCGVLYTQVDGEPPEGSEHDVCYDRGLHVCNRTGIYEVVLEMDP